MSDSRNWFHRANLWIADRVWLAILSLVVSVVLLGFALLVVTGRVDTNSTKLTELRYRSCIEDAVLEFKIAEGDAVFAAFNRDNAALTKAIGPYRDALEHLRGAQQACRSQFPE